MLKKLCATGFVAAAATGALLLGGPAHAEEGSNNGILNGNNVNPAVNACHINVPIIGGSDVDVPLNLLNNGMSSSVSNDSCTAATQTNDG